VNPTDSSGDAIEPKPSAVEPQWLQPVEYPDPGSAVDRVVGQLRRQIMSGILVPGRELSARAVAQQLGVSFIPVREALRILAAEGMVIIHSRRGASVPALSRQEFRELIALRRRLEPMLCARACREARTELLSSLEARIPIAKSGPDGIVETLEARIQWYAELLGPSLTNYELRVLVCLWRQIMRYLYPSYRRHDPSCDEGHAERFQRDIVRAFKEHDVDEVRAVTTRLLERHESVGIRALGD
jgi:DNA-binding GntR family transcriptional regulator